QSGVARASVRLLPSRNRDEPRKRRRGKIIAGDDYREGCVLQRLVCERQREPQELLPVGYGQGLIGRRGSRRCLLKNLLYPLDVQRPAAGAVLETAQDLFCLFDLSGLKIEHPKGGI